ncbi:MAG: hypothetical protein MRECE_8c040 [Mycoplasmataceae bacterium CE_OT135]|nr:MAG: hypothetical protein MRECE_8c040 [Mycoplasmataceae bacterium CE_OT135]
MFKLFFYCAIYKILCWIDLFGLIFRPDFWGIC